MLIHIMLLLVTMIACSPYVGIPSLTHSSSSSFLVTLVENCRGTPPSGPALVVHDLLHRRNRWAGRLRESLHTAHKAYEGWCA